MIIGTAPLVGGATAVVGGETTMTETEEGGTGVGHQGGGAQTMTDREMFPWKDLNFSSNLGPSLARISPALALPVCTADTQHLYTTRILL